ncbi:MAG TPA: T9SS type A sorting domain-containing protein, partial [Candidatus Kapabacteria bacterium]|nr:T9SS type A sorting domain-containing protein [Candidatus Kapabacteria bacterium]
SPKDNASGNYYRIWDMALDPSNVLYAATDGGLYKTSDRGMSIQSAGFSGKTVYDIDWDTLGRLVVSTEEGVYRRIASTWENLSDQLPTKRYYSIHAAPNGYLYTGTTNTEIYRSTNNGISWQLKATGIAGTNTSAQSVGKIFSLPNGDLMAGTSGHSFRSTNQGDTWIKDPELSDVTTIVYYDSDVILLDGNIWRSHDKGVTFERINTNLGAAYPNDGFISAAKNSKGELFIGTVFFGGGGKLFKSPDLGHTWELINNDGNMHDLACDAMDFLYRSTSTSGLKRSITPVLSVFPQAIPFSVSIFPNPLASECIVRYDLGADSHVSLTVTNILGNEVHRLLDEFQSQGSHDVDLDLSVLSPGQYFVVTTINGTTHASHISIIR